MNKTKIDWADSSWNPITGCYHGCAYCYANGIATRFAGFLPEENPNTWGFRRNGTLVELDGMQSRMRKDGKIVPAPYPHGFTPTLHRYRLDDPVRWTKPHTIFVGSMAEIFGDWVPDEWIKEVFEACERAPQHRYLFLTKNPKRYQQLYDAKMLQYSDNFWFGSTLTKPTDSFTWFKDTPYHGFVSIEPIMEPFGALSANGLPEWVIVGAETGNRKDKVFPQRWWIEQLSAECSKHGIPLFMKKSLRDLMGADFVQEFPWDIGGREDG